MRTFIGTTLLILACLVPQGTVGPGASASAAEKKPNILLVLTDDQRSGLKVMPDTRKLIRRAGTDFTRAYSTTPNCCPSRSSIFTGRYAHNHGVIGNGRARQLDQKTTIQRYLSEAGYVNALFGKYLNGWGIDKPPPYFDHFALLKTGRREPRYYGSKWNLNGEFVDVDGYSTDYIRRRSLAFLDRQEKPETDDRPWFMYIAPNAPHNPSRPSRKYRGVGVPKWRGNPAVFEQDKSDKPPFVARASTTLRHGQRQRARQLRTLMSVDDLIEDVYLRMKALGERRDTIVIFMSDNGFLWGEHGLRGKRLPYPQATSISFLMSWPGHVPYGITDKRLVANIDVAPTLVDAVGLEDQVEHVMDGRSLLDDSWSRNRLLLEDWQRDWSSTVTNTYQYTEYYDDRGATAFREYYNMKKDPWQLTNLLDSRRQGDVPGDLADLKSQLRKDRSCVGVTCP